MKNFLFVLCLALSGYASAGITIDPPGTIVNYQDCTRTGAQYDATMKLSNMIFECPEDQAQVLLYEAQVTVHNNVGNYFIKNCFIDELIYSEVTNVWGMNLECGYKFNFQSSKGGALYPIDLTTHVFGWNNCNVNAAYSYETTTPETYSLHCEDPEPQNDDYFIELEDNYISIDRGNKGEEIYYNCELVYFKQKFNTNSIKADFKTVCWD